MRLIDADALMEDVEQQVRLTESFAGAGFFTELLEGVKALQKLFEEELTRIPTIEVEPVRRGKWKQAWFDPRKVCSEYACFSDEMTDYCPHCGARMGKGD